MGKNIYLQIADRLNDSSSLVLATIISKQGSAPQVPGSTAVFGSKGLIAGTVGGGAVEGDVTAIAAERLKSLESGYIHFNLVNDISRKEEAICGGQLSILVDATPFKNAGVFSQVRDSILNNQKGILLTFVKGLSEKGTTVDRYWISDGINPEIPEDISELAGPAIRKMLDSAEPASLITIEVSSAVNKDALLFLEQILPPPKLVIAGAGHIGKALSHLANILGFEVTVVDDRPEFANKENIPDAQNIVVKEISSAIRELRKGPDTYIVIVTRGHKDDAEALRQCIGTDLAYIGMIGSRHKIKAMRDEFIDKGWATPGQWEEIYSPIGLEINSQTVEEIAVSIAAQLIMVKNSGSGKRKSCPA